MLTSIPPKWIETWGTMNSVGKLVHLSSAAEAPIINLLGNCFQLKDSLCIAGSDPDEMEIS